MFPPQSVSMQSPSLPISVNPISNFVRPLIPEKVLFSCGHIQKTRTQINYKNPGSKIWRMIRHRFSHSSQTTTGEDEDREQRMQKFIDHHNDPETLNPFRERRRHAPTAKGVIQTIALTLAEAPTPFSALKAVQKNAERLADKTKALTNKIPIKKQQEVDKQARRGDRDLPVEPTPEPESEYKLVPTSRSPTRRELREEDEEIENSGHGAANGDSEDETMRLVGTIRVFGVTDWFHSVIGKINTKLGSIIGLGISFHASGPGIDIVKRSKPEPVTELIIPQVESFISRQTSQVQATPISFVDPANISLAGSPTTTTRRMNLPNARSCSHSPPDEPELIKFTAEEGSRILEQIKKYFEMPQNFTPREILLAGRKLGHHASELFFCQPERPSLPPNVRRTPAQGRHSRNRESLPITMSAQDYYKRQKIDVLAEKLDWSEVEESAGEAVADERGWREEENWDAGVEDAPRTVTRLIWTDLTLNEVRCYDSSRWAKHRVPRVKLSPLRNETVVEEWSV